MRGWSKFPPPTATPTANPEIQISVSVEGYVPGVWSNVKPVFTLSGIPEGDGKHAYAVVAYDERFIILSGSTFTAIDEGTYEVRFVILDGIGDVVSMSAKYALMLDYAAPTYISVQMDGDSYTDYLAFAEDSLSGIAGYSNDGGATWIAPDEDGGARFVGQIGRHGSRGHDPREGQRGEYPGI